MILMNGHKISQVCCLNCHRRWTAARPVDTKLCELECPECGTLGDVIETGETCVAEDLIHQASER